MAHRPSSYLIKRLWVQEVLQRRCGPGTEPYARPLEQLRSGQTNADNVDSCSYLGLISYRQPDARHGRRGTAFVLCIAAPRGPVLLRRLREAPTAPAMSGAIFFVC